MKKKYFVDSVSCIPGILNPGSPRGTLNISLVKRLFGKIYGTHPMGSEDMDYIYDKSDDFAARMQAGRVLNLEIVVKRCRDCFLVPQGCHHPRHHGI